VLDGRPSGSTFFETSTQSLKVCGIATTSTHVFSHVLRNSVGDFYFRPQQSTSAYLRSTVDDKNLFSTVGISNDTAMNFDEVTPNPICKYWIESGVSRQAVVITLTWTNFTRNGRLRIFAGVFGNDSLAFDSNRDSDRNTVPVNITIPCGRSFILVETNATNSSTSIIDYSWSFSYEAVQGDTGGLCELYGKSFYGNQ
jgi:hypothetical protein